MTFSWAEFQKYMAALCAWREAAEEGHDGIRGVIHVIANRANQQRRSWAEVVYAKLQFSSMTAPGDPQLTKVPTLPDPVFEDCYAVADLIYSGGDFDLTEGATFYRNPATATSQWFQTAIDTGKLVKTVTINHHDFYKG